MPPSRIQARPRRVNLTLRGAILDLILSALLGIWFFGGFTWHDHVYFRHGADPRRASILVAILAYVALPWTRTESFLLMSGLRFGRRLTRPVFRWTFFGVIVLWAVFISIQQTLALRTPLYDVGIFHQIYWGLIHGLGFHSTISGAGNFMEDHLSPSLLILAPAFWIVQGTPLFLSIAHPLLLWGGAAAWIYLAERVPEASQKLRNTLAAATTLFVCSFESLWGNLKWGFHENALAFFSLSWAFALFFKATSAPPLRTFMIFVLFCIAAGSKEILLLDVAVVFVIWAIIEFVRSKKLFVSLSLLLSSVALIILFFAFEKMSHPADKNYFVRYYAYLGTNLDNFLSAFVQLPILVLKNIGWKELTQYVFVVFSPWLFLPLFGKPHRNALWLLVGAPSFASAALATYPPLRRPEFHYVLELWPVLACLTLLSLSRYKSNWVIWSWALFTLFRWDTDPIAQSREYARDYRNALPVRTLLQHVPLDVGVAADELAGPWIAGRPWITRWPSLSLLPEECPTFVILNQGKIEPSSLEIHSRCGTATLIHRVNTWSFFEMIKPNPLANSANSSEADEK